MVLLVVEIAIAVVALVVLGSLVYVLLGAVGRLRRELAALDRDVAPVLGQLQDTMARVAQVAQREPDRS